MLLADSRSRSYYTSSFPSNLLLPGQRLVNPFNDVYRGKGVPGRPPTPDSTESREGFASRRTEFGKGRKGFGGRGERRSRNRRKHAFCRSIPLRESTTSPGNRHCQRYEERVADKFETFCGICRLSWILQKCFLFLLPFVTFP